MSIKTFLISFFFVCLFVLFGCGKQSDVVVHDVEIGFIPIQDVTPENPNLVIDFQYKLADLILNYVNAQYATHLLLSVNPSKMSLESYMEFGQDVVDQRSLVERNAYDIGNLFASRQNRFFATLKYLFVPPLYAQNIGIVDRSHSFNTAPVQMFSPDDIHLSNDMMNNFVLPPNVDYYDGLPVDMVIESNKRAQVEILRGAMPELGLLGSVQSIFGTTAQEAKLLVDDHFKAAAKVYANQAAFYAKAESTAQAINTTSKVSLYVGGAVLTAGGSTLLTAPVGGALVAGMGTSLTAGKATIITLGGVNTILGVGADSAVIGVATTGTAVTFKSMKEEYAPISTLLSFLDLKDGLQNPGNLLTLYDRGNALFSQGDDHLTMRVSDDTFIVSNYHPQQEYLTQDGLLQYAPQSLLDQLVTPQEIQQIQEQSIRDAEAQKQQREANFGNVGVYIGTTKFQFDLQGQQKIFDIGTQLLVGTHGDVTFKFEGRDSFSFSLQGLSLSFDHTLEGTAVGNVGVDGKNLSAVGDFTSSAKMHPPKGMQIPPQYAAQMQGGGFGTISIVGTIDAGVFVGTAVFEGNGLVYESPMRLVIQ